MRKPVPNDQVLMLFEKSPVDASANEPTFWPALCSNEDFMQWATHVGLRLKNLPPNPPEYLIRRALFSKGTPSPEWAEALKFMMTLARSNKREAKTG